MSVDLYIHSRDKPLGHYKEGYSTPDSIIWTLGLSWHRDVGSMLDNDSYLQPDKARELLALVKNNAQKFPTAQDLIERFAKVDKDKNSIEAWHKKYADGRKELIEFLEKAIELNEPIYCSI